MYVTVPAPDAVNIILSTHGHIVVLVLVVVVGHVLQSPINVTCSRLPGATPGVDAEHT